MYSWLRAENSAADHPKVMALATALGDVEIALADGYVFRLWCWTHRYKPGGAFPATVVPQLERYIGREGVIALMVGVGLVDEVSGGFCVHDWEVMQGDLVEKSSRDAKKKRTARRANGAKTARARRANGARSAPLQDRTGQDTTDKTEPTGPTAEAAAANAIANAWNETTTPPLPRVTLPLGVVRTEALAAADKRRPIEAWRTVFERINRSSYCRGAKGWVADIDWATRPEGKKPEPATKVLEGAFDDRTPAGRDADVQYTESRSFT